MSPFFNLPGELRNAVYDELWKMKNRVAARHHNTRTGILAYYDGMRLDEANVTGYCEIRGTLQDKQWSPGKHAGLPIWLLANKQVLKEGMSIFRANAHWNVWSLKKSNERFRQYWEESNSDTWLMHPKYATSVTLCRMTISLRKMAKTAKPGFIVWRILARSAKHQTFSICISRWPTHIFLQTTPAKCPLTACNFLYATYV
jgi:hypothetical protein